MDDVVVVGGSSRMPKIRSDLQAYFPTSTIHMADDRISPDEAVAVGAALWAARLPAGEDGVPVAGQTLGRRWRTRWRRQSGYSTDTSASWRASMPLRLPEHRQILCTPLRFCVSRRTHATAAVTFPFHCRM